MANCLVTKLKGAVQNSDLLKLGEFDIVLGNYGALTWCTIYPLERVEITGNGYFTDSTGTQNLGKVLTNVTSSFHIIGYSEGDKLKCISKYDITYFSFPDNIWGIFKAGEPLDSDYMGKVIYFNIGNGGGGCVVNIENFNNIIIETFRTPYSAHVYGALEKFVEKALSLGRTSGSTAFSNYRGTHVTFKGQTMAALYSSIGLDWMRIFYSASGATIINGDGQTGDLLATYANGTWTYEF